MAGLFLRLLQERPIFRSLYCAVGISTMGDQFTRTASAVMALKLTGSAAPMALVYLSSFLPGVVLGPVAGTWADRGDKRRIMVLWDLVRAAAVLAMGFAGNVWELYGLALLLGTGSTLFSPAYYASLPETVEREEIMPANQLVEFTTVVTEVLGSVLAVAWLTAVSMRTAFAWDALSFVASALFLRGLPKAAGKPPAPAESGAPSLWEAVREGLTYSLRDPLVSTSTLVQFLAALGFFGMNALLPLFARAMFGREEYWGLLPAAITAGAMLGALLPGWFAARIGRGATVALGLTAGAVAIFGALLTHSPAVILGCFFLSGLANPLFNVTTGSWLQEQVPGQMLGRVISFRRKTRTVAVAASVTGAGFLVDRVGLYAVWWGLGSFVLAAGVVALLLVRITAPAAHPG